MIQSSNGSVQFYVKHDQNMFVNKNQNSLVCSSNDHQQFDQKKRYDKEIQELEDKLTKQKLFMNMVIHDLRNPAESIK